MSECLDEEAILSFCRGSMAVERRPAAEAHIAECDECRVLVSAVMRSSLVDGAARPSPPASDPAMAPTTPLHGGLRGGDISGTPTKPTGPVRVGEVLAGKYEVERVLGAGGMGVVVAARHTQLDQRFALKFLLPAACETPGAVARFLREGKAAARITSEHVARVVDTGTLDDGAPYLVMEYLEGADLGAVSQERGPLPANEVVDYVLQACEAIVEAHQLGIVHRDLKPANLFLTKRKDGSPLVKVLDFGISKAEGGSQPALTSTSTLMGSPRYMSPEQMVSAKDVDARTDVWALGVIIHELMTGQPVWHADTVQGLCALIATAPAPPLREIVPSAPAVLEGVVLRCLAKAPGDRIPSVAELATALGPVAPEQARTSIDRILRVAGHERALGSLRAASAPPPSVPTPSSGAGRVVVLLGVLVALLIVVGVVLNTLGLGLARGGPASAVEPSEPSAAEPSAAPAAPSSAAEPGPIVPEPTTASVEAEPSSSATSARPLASRAAPARPRVVDPARAASARPRGPAVPPSPPASEPTPNRALSDRK